MAHNIESRDLDQMIRNWALCEFDNTATWRQKSSPEEEDEREQLHAGEHPLLTGEVP